LWRSGLGCELSYLPQVKAKRFDLSQDAIEPRLIQHAGQDRLRALPLTRHSRKRGKQGCAEMPVDPDQVPGGCRIHTVMIRRDQVKPHHQDLVMRALPKHVP
jgi:hypothetical protein